MSTIPNEGRHASAGGLLQLQQLPCGQSQLIVVVVQATGARLSEESRAAEEMIARFTQWQGRNSWSIAADASYGNGELLRWLIDRQVT